MSTYTDLAKLENSRHCLRRIARHDEPQFSKDSIVNVMEKFVKTVNAMGETILVPSRLMDRQVGDSTDIIPAPGKDSNSNQHALHAHGGHGKRSITHSKNVHEFLNSSELFNLYNMLHALKNELLWTGKDAAVEEEEYNFMMAQNKMYDLDTNDMRMLRTESELTMEAANAADANNSTLTASSSSGTVTSVGSSSISNCSSSATIKGHNRRPSTASVASTVSVVSVSNLSDSESEISNENDSGVEFEGNKSDTPQSSAGSTSSSENMRAQKDANVDKATDLALRCKRHLNGLYHCLEQMTEAANYLSARYQSDIGPV